MAKLKIILFFIVVLIGYSSLASAQTKVGYIDSKKIIDAMQESRDAKTRLDNQVTEWQIELTKLQDSSKIIKEDYDKKKLILTDALKTQFETDIKRLDDAITNFKVQKFGENGEYFQKQVEFMKPVQDRIFLAIEKVAKEDGFDYVFDRSSEILLLYVNEKYDLTAKVQKIVEGK
jgi:outer membrane protein